MTTSTKSRLQAEEMCGKALSWKMEPVMKANGKRDLIFVRGVASRSGLTAPCTKGTGSTTRLTVRVD